MVAVTLASTLREQHVVVLGGAYAGLSMALNLLRICDGTIGSFRRGSKGGRGGQSMTPQAPQMMPKITILDPRDGFYHAVGTPMAHTTKSYIDQPWRTWDQIPELKRHSVSILKGTAVRADPRSKRLLYLSHESSSQDQHVLDYDYLVVATGLRRPWPTIPVAATKAEYAVQAGRYIDRLQKCNSVVIIGGGAVGIEMAAEIKHRYPTKQVTLIHSRSSLLSSEPVSPEFRDQVLEVVKHGGVNVILENRVLSAIEGLSTVKTIRLQTGSQLTADEVIWATSSAAPVTEFLPKEALDERGFVNVLPTTQFVADIPNNNFHFAIGDVIATPGIRLAKTAIRMGSTAAMNIAQMMVSAEQGEEVQSSLAQMRGPNKGLSLIIGGSGAAFDGKTGDVVSGPQVKNGIFGDDMALHRKYSSLESWRSETLIGLQVHLVRSDYRWFHKLEWPIYE
ncbi:NAD(P)/FAD-dependent oxidoreductase [Aspergillus homomorphus CBS 101889]|uniref:FAD/NAD(P)-binding domain-containing protein n=1 Tax=Aspergillus homomorphus (strain CBS 101889) TaxID=1450537 RepID=A0A395HLX9_ASPHC|nr:FAD/NAD(P)-binding domain-containing protein [Aspergillus homomorphus CBS 101889]RAL08235.1 FAD/NAD(P)-binding domain-containing protein [Aspergillus homomorphus CBS 101889]